MLQHNRKIITVFIALSCLFFALIGYLTYFELLVKDKIITSSYNRRLWEREERTLRGAIFDRSGVVLAKSTRQGEHQQRVYPYGALYSHVIGYNSLAYGKTLLEAKYNNQLLNINELNPVTDLKNKLTGTKSVGNNLYLTIDHRLQAHAAALLAGRKGAIVVLNPRTGEILAMVSKPDFNPNLNKLTANWSELVESTDNPFLPRATQGLYVPGSTYKVLISTAALNNGLGEQTYTDTGSILISGKKFSNFGHEVYGQLDLTRALAVSCNTYFARMGVQLGADALKENAKQFCIGKTIPFDLPVKISRFDYQLMQKPDLAAVGIGQGRILVTPMQMALVAGTVANDGVMMRPLLVKQVITPHGYVLQDRQPRSLAEVMTPETAAKLKTMMEAVVDTGTGTNARIRGIRVAGKTGTAENELTGKQANKEHAWFVGFAPAENPQIAVAVIVEYAGSTGGKLAAPMARALMADWLRR